jgi:hypothetical protein
LNASVSLVQLASGRKQAQPSMEPMMQLERIRIEGLFGRFTYDIGLHRPEKITIIHAPNGFGKTVVLTLIHAFFSRHFYIFFKYQFKTMTLHFDTRESIEIRKEGAPDLFIDKAKDSPELSFIVHSSTRPNDAFKYKSSDAPAKLNRYLPFLHQAGPDTWFDENEEEIIPAAEVLVRYGAHFPPQLRKGLEIPGWLATFADSSDCRLIETQRLLRIAHYQAPPRTSRRSYTPPRPVVEAEARDLANRIGATLAEYANSAQSLDQSFPRRVLAALHSRDALLPEDVSLRLRNVDKKRSSLIEAGLLDKSGAPATGVPQ